MHAASGMDTVPSGYENLRKPEVTALLWVSESKQSPWSCAAALLRNAEVLDYLAERQAEIAQDMTQKDYWERAVADPSARSPRSEMLRSTSFDGRLEKQSP